MSDYFWELGNTRLRPLRENDVERYLSADLDSEAKRSLNYAVGLPRSLESQAESLPVNFKNAPARLDFAVETSSGEFVGSVAISDINEQSGTFSTVSFILKDYRRSGHAERAKDLMLRYMFGERRFQKYNTVCMESNTAIIAHLKKLGCKEEGRRRRTIYTNGRFYDQLLFGLTKEEWESKDADT